MSSVLITPCPIDEASRESLAAEGIAFLIEEDITRLENYAAQPLRAIVLNAEGHLKDTPYLCREIRMLFKATPLLVVTAHYPDSRKEALKAGANELLTAPLDPVELQWRLRQIEQHTHEYAQWGGVSNILIHDLKSPLGTIVSSLEVLRELVEDESGQLLIDNSLRAIRRQSELLDDSLDFLLMKNQAYRVELQPVSLSDIFEVVQEHMNPMLKIKEMVLETHLADDIPPVQADNHLLIRVLKAMIDNSIKFCLRKSVIRLSAWVEHPYALIELTDQGRVIMSRFEAELFSLSRQWEARTAGSRSTIALNLPFTKAAVQLMGGDISAATREGITTFKLHLPLA